MEFKTTIQALEQLLKYPLPGEEAQQEMAPFDRPTRAKAMAQDTNPRLSAVLALLYPKKGETHLVLTLRSSYKGVHSKQVSFPGGKKEEEDPDLLHTALREANEEVGINTQEVEVVSPLTQLYIPPSRFLVQPYLGISQQTPDFTPDPREVQEILQVPLRWLYDPKRQRSEKIPVMNGKYTVDAPFFDLFDQRVWGATAMILSEIRTLMKSAAS